MDIERTFITKVVAENLANDAVEAQITGELFVDKNNKEVYNFILEYYEQYQSTPSEDVIELKFPNFTWSLAQAEFSFLVDELTKKDVSNKVENAILDLSRLYKNDKPYEVIEQMVKYSSELSSGARLGEDKNWIECTEERKEIYLKAEALNGITGIRTPFPSLNEFTGGIQETDYWLIIARPSVGKSWNIGLFAHFANKYENKRVLLISPEMSSMLFFQRIDAIEAQLPYAKLRMGRLSLEDKNRYFESLDTLRDCRRDLWIPKMKGGGISYLRNKIRTYKPDITFVDAMYLFKDDLKGKSSSERLGNISRQLKGLTEEEGCPIVASSQLNREGLDEGADLDTIYNSDALGQDADAAIFMFQPEEYRISTPQKMLLKIKKFRAGVGQPWKSIINWDLDKMDFSELPESAEVESKWEETFEY